MSPASRTPTWTSAGGTARSRKPPSPIPRGYYQYPTAEGGPLGRWIVNEQGFARFGVSGAALHDEYDPSVVTPIPTDLGGALLTNQLLTEGHRATVDWGKTDYPAGTPGQIVGITYFSTTRNEFDARFQAHEDYEPAIPDVTVYLETLGADGLPNTADDVVVNKYVTDHWVQPSGTPPAESGDVRTGLCGPRRDRRGHQRPAEPGHRAELPRGPDHR